MSEARTLELCPEESLSLRFHRLLRIWRAETKFVSAYDELVLHPAYQEIIAMGLPAIPLLLEELQHKPDLFFWALTEITGEDPVPDSLKGNLPAMIAVWLHWGRERGYVK